MKVKPSRIPYRDFLPALTIAAFAVTLYLVAGAHVREVAVSNALAMPLAWPSIVGVV